MADLRFLLLSALLYLLPSSSESRPLQWSPSTLLTDGVSGKTTLYCDSWRYSVETNDAGPWKTVPARCGSYVADYMNGLQYLSDSNIVAADALEFARGAANRDGKDVWVFDVDETLLSNLPYYTVNGYGTVPYNETKWNVWMDSEMAPALPASLKLYDELRSLGIKLVLLTGRDEDSRKTTEDNLKSAGYTSWDRLILREATDHGKTATAYKSSKRAELVAQGYRILGSSGDQWSDLLGSPVATRSFKLPNPMYYIA